MDALLPEDHGHVGACLSRGQEPNTSLSFLLWRTRRSGRRASALRRAQGREGDRLPTGPVHSCTSGPGVNAAQDHMPRTQEPLRPWEQGQGAPTALPSPPGAPESPTKRGGQRPKGSCCLGEAARLPNCGNRGSCVSQAVRRGLTGHPAGAWAQAAFSHSLAIASS